MSDDADSDLTFLVSPTERNELTQLPNVTLSMLPERYGCDVAWRAHDSWHGVQRKELRDFLASVSDGRLARELAQMSALPFPVLVIEGSIKYDSNANLMWSTRGQQITRSQFRGMLWSVRARGVHVDFTLSSKETAEYVHTLARWSVKDKHQSLMRRPGPVNMWGKVGNQDFAWHVLQGFDGIGLDKAKSIVEWFGGVPLVWKCSEAEMRKVPGVGKVLARRLMEALMVEQVRDGTGDEEGTG